MPEIPNLLTDKTKCCGCRGCANVCPTEAISFSPDENGFVYPKIDGSKCIGCNACVNTCIYKNEPVKRMPQKCFAGVNNDSLVLKESSSGGAFSAIAEMVLDQNGVVFGVAMDENFNVSHICVETKDNLEKLRGSKYSQSDTNTVYKQVKKKLAEGRKVLFTGTPCQVAALYSVLKNTNTENLLTADIVCHGNPSNLMFKKYIAYLEKKHKLKISNYNFRTKERTWFRSEEAFDSKESNRYNVRVGKFEEFYHTSFVTGNITQPSCFNCQFSEPKRCSDFTIGDFWGFNKANITLDERKGLSVITANTEKAMLCIKKLKKYITLEEVDYTLAVKGNTALRQPTAKGRLWEYYMKAYREDNIEQAAKRYRKNHKKKIMKQRFMFDIPYPLFKLIRFRK